MSKANAARRRRVAPIVVAVLNPVARRLSRIEALLLELLHEQDVQVKRVATLQALRDTLAENVSVNAEDIQRISLRSKGRVRPVPSQATTEK